MGTVYKARHRRMKRIVAVKLLSRRIAESKEFVQRFQREVEAVARLSHPNIVMAHDADEAEAGHFLVMEFVDGRDLASEVQKHGPLTVAAAVDCVLQAARALEYAHKKGIVHRDIKPANLLRDVTGVVKVADLGLARFNEQIGPPPDEMGALTQAGSIMGTVDFMPPEQALGLLDIDHRADIYSLGCTLHFLLSGRPPYQAPTLMAVLLKHREAPIPPLTAARGALPAGLSEIFQRMVAKKPEDRFASMSEVARALEALSLSTPAAPDAPPPDEWAATLQLPGRQAIPPKPAPEGGTVNWGAEQAAKPQAGSPAARTLLLVEPSRSQAVIIRGYLQKLGYAEVVSAASGEKALELARQSPPAALISAMHLPDMTAVQLAQALRTEQKLSSVGFVLITSQADDSEANLSQTARIVRLPKPFDVEQLRRALEAATSPRPAEPAASADLGSLRVLIVDDSAAARRHIRTVLTGLGLRQISEAADGAEAKSVLEKQTFDLVVTDYNMPNLDGRGLIEFIRRRSKTPAVPVVMVTTETDPAKLDAVRQLGVSAICDKSFPAAVVRGVLASCRSGFPA
jgi:CheY-like chemotaxis protein/tRNA A-37 threonylcarbamoyl transferase component Bud32